MLRGCSPRGLRLLGTIRAAYALEVNSWSTPECNNESYLNKKGKMGDIDIERAIVSHYWKSARHSFSSSSSHNSDRHLKEFRCVLENIFLISGLIKFSPTFFFTFHLTGLHKPEKASRIVSWSNGLSKRAIQWKNLVEYARYSLIKLP